MKDLVKVLYSKPTLFYAAEAVVEIYGSSLVGGIPARDNGWHVPPRARRDVHPYYTYPLYAPSVEALKKNIAQRYNEQDYIIEYTEV